MTKKVTRRDFTRLSAAAVGGVMVGSMVGCGGKTDSSGNGKKGDSPAAGTDIKLMLNDTNVCRGLNTCKGNGKGEHDCAGKGSCAAAEAHKCGEKNKCKGQGGCGESVGMNACNAKGHCAVPLSDKAWKTARANFEKVMKDGKKPFGDAPAKM